MFLIFVKIRLPFFAPHDTLSSSLIAFGHEVLSPNRCDICARQSEGKKPLNDTQ